MNRNWKDVPIPDMMKHLEKDPRGYPIPVVVLRDKNNKAHFQINDQKIYQEIIDNNQCSICGNKLSDNMWFVGGVQSALHPKGAYIDSPVHEECGHYAMKVCPYLAVPKYGKRLDASTINKDNFSGFVFQDPTVDPKRPPLFVMGLTTEYMLKRYSTGEQYLIPKRPFKKIQFWNAGQEISLENAYPILRELKLF